MADNSSFLKTVTFGGYDKGDVEKRLNYLYGQLYELKNDLRESKQALDEYRKGTSEEKIHETSLAAERAKLTMIQVQNESLNQKVKETRDELSHANDQISELTQKADRLSEELEKAQASIAAYEAGNDPAALSKVFIEAQKSAEMLKSDAASEAKALKKQAEEAVDNMINDANDRAENIIFEAEKQAAEINARIANESEEMKVASENLKAVMLSDIKSIGAELAGVRELFASIEENAFGKLRESEELLNSTENKLCSGGVPVFREPKHIDPVMPKKKPTASEKKKTSSDLEKLMNMADSLEDTYQDKQSESGEDMKSILQQAEAIGEPQPKSDLDALLEQAEALGGGNSSAGNGALDLDAIMRQAEALGN